MRSGDSHRHSCRGLIASFPGPCASSGGRLPAALFMVIQLDSKGAKACTSCRSRQELSNEYLVFQRHKSDPSVIVFSEIKCCQLPHFTQFFQTAKTGPGEVRLSARSDLLLRWSAGKDGTDGRPSPLGVMGMVSKIGKIYKKKLQIL